MLVGLRLRRLLREATIHPASGSKIAVKSHCQLSEMKRRVLSNHVILTVNVVSKVRMVRGVCPFFASSNAESERWSSCTRTSAALRSHDHVVVAYRLTSCRSD